MCRMKRILVLLMALSLLLLTGCAKEAVGVPYNYVLPFASLRVYVGCQSEVYIDGTIYGTTPSGILTQNSGSSAIYITDEFVPCKSQVGWTFCGRSNYDEVMRGFLQYNGKPVVDTAPLLPYVLAADRYVNIYVIVADYDISGYVSCLQSQGYAEAFDVLKAQEELDAARDAYTEALEALEKAKAAPLVLAEE